MNAPDESPDLGALPRGTRRQREHRHGRAAEKADTMTTPSTDHAKRLAKLLREDLAAGGFDIPHSLALELVAHQLGTRDWNVLAAALRKNISRYEISPGVPVLRVMSMTHALPFYVGYLGFRLDWEHRFEPGTPAYAQVSRSQAVLHLSEHHGDGSPNGVVWLPVADVAALQRELHARPDAPMRPGIERDAPGGPTLEVIDPYGNVLRFAQAGSD
ncbi:glyoxalase superfamily protein [Paractinoplanes rishiriensis]|uniref:glyoxalase superfamily protein n=1 Tax=Paractinoplanes rishiriensis TaxID=1050105 RepID=UPI0019416E36|nr:glyoxalase superfamily protein [Actinoplanes rishiriensis]